MDRYFIEKDDSLLLLIDIQEKLFRVMEEKVQNNLIKNCTILIKTAAEFNIPIVVTEQYRKGLGTTIPVLAEHIGGASNLEKLHFDCMKDLEIRKTIISSGKKTVILAGIESHICVFQTALSLLKEKFNVIITCDAVGSRRENDRESALSVLAGAGALVYPTESIAFMIIEKAGTQEFRALSPMFK